LSAQCCLCLFVAHFQHRSACDVEASHLEPCQMMRGVRKLYLKADMTPRLPQPEAAVNGRVVKCMRCHLALPPRTLTEHAATCTFAVCTSQLGFTLEMMVRGRGVGGDRQCDRKRSGGTNPAVLSVALLCWRHVRMGRHCRHRPQLLRRTAGWRRAFPRWTTSLCRASSPFRESHGSSNFKRI